MKEEKRNWIKVNRKILEWEWHDEPGMMSLFIHLLLLANFESTTWRGVKIDRGQIITTRGKLSELVGISEQQVRDRLNKLAASKVITKTSTNNYTIITICKYDEYQLSEQPKEPTKKPTKNQQKTNEEPTYSLKRKRIKEKLLTEGCGSLNETALPEENKGGKQPTLVHKARVVFECSFQELFGESYYWTAKDAAAMQQLLQKIAFARKGRNLETDDDSLLYALKAFLGTIQEGWILENYTTTKINAQYNEIVSHAKAKLINGHNRTGTTKEQMYRDAAELVEELLAGNG